jgi:multidrug resistance efflux pump
MEILLLGIYSFFVWLIFFKFKWLPWNIVSQVIVITIPIVGLTMLILMLNIVAPSSHDVRVVNYVIPINPPVRGLVTQVPIEPNRPIKKGDVLFKIDPTPYEIAVTNYEAQISQLRVQLVTAGASSRNLQEQLKAPQVKRKRSTRNSNFPGCECNSSKNSQRAAQATGSITNKRKLMCKISKANSLPPSPWKRNREKNSVPKHPKVNRTKSPM